MKLAQLKSYEIPHIDLLVLAADDVLTLSNGFDGEEDVLFHSTNLL